MQKLADYVRIEPRRSPIDVCCTINPQHVTKTYFNFTVELPHAVFETDNVGGEVASKPQIDFAICPPCMIQFMSDSHQKIQQMNEFLT